MNMTLRVAAKPALIAWALLFGSVVSGQAAWTPTWKTSTIEINCPGAEARSSLARRAANGDADARDRLGSFHVSTCSGQKDPGEGIRLLEGAALQGSVHAQFMLGVVYRGGHGVTPDFTKALAWSEKGALADSAGAQNDLGLALQLGKGVVKNEANAARMFRLAAQQSLPEAEYNLAAMYDLGAGLTQDYAQARHWYERASND